MSDEVGKLRSEEANGNALLPIFAIVVVDTAGAGLILPLLPFYARDFGAAPLTIGFLFASFAICEFFAGPILGNASDRLGRKRLLLISQMGTCVSLLLLAVAPNLVVVFVARILGGLSAANVAIAIAYVADRSEAKTRRQAIGFASAAMGLGTMLGPALGGALAPKGLAVPFLVAAVFSLTSIIATSTLLPKDDRAWLPLRSCSRVFRKRQRPSDQSNSDERAVDDSATASLSLRRFVREMADLIALPNVKAILTALAILYLAFSRKRYEWPTGISVDICRVPRPVGFRTSALSAAA